MKNVRVNLGSRAYSVYIGNGALSNISSLVNVRQKNRPVFVVTNKKIKSLHGGLLKKHLKKISSNILFCEVPDSEKAKSFSVYLKTVSALSHFARKKTPLLVAFGGGVIGDLTGFVASTYRRGVPYINVPTTLLAQVDSAIGGKVAIDIEAAKNIVGNFYQPKMVVCDTHFLKTLPEKEVRNGLAEIVKYGIIKDKRFFSFLERNLRNIIKLEDRPLEHAIFKSCYMKARVVEKDEYDTKKMRAILNFGHTIGHAIEAASQYAKSTTHGQAVAIGMIKACYIALRLKMIKKSDYERMVSLIRRASPKIRLKYARQGRILNALSYDKKFTAGVNRFILPSGIGRVRVVDNIPQNLIKEAIQDS